jgi:hypothetical protein
MVNKSRHGERGISLLLSLLTLMLLSAVAIGSVYMASTETWISANFKAEETAYFAARAGVEEVRDRMLPSNPNTLAPQLPAVPAGAAGGVLYVLQPGVTLANVTDMTSKFKDDELCHDWGNPSTAGMTWQPANVACTDLPAAPGWANSTNSVAPFAGSPNPLEYKWVRVTLKANNSSAFRVDNAPGSDSYQACWNGISEVVAAPGTACSALFPTANPVYLVTSLAVTPSGARRLVQQELSQTPSGGFPYGAFATSTGCGAMNLAGGARTFSFNSATENPPTNPPSNITTSGGNVGSNGNVTLAGGGTTVNGTTSSAVAGVGNCNQGNGITANGGAAYGTPALIPTQSLPVPPLPNPLPPTRAQNVNNSQVLPPGAYGNLNIQGGAVVTLQGGTTASPAVYTVNSLSLAGGSTLVITGPVVLNVAGVGQQNPIDFSGGSFQNNTYLANNFVINYGGTHNISVNGGAGAYAVINAPNANVSFSGGSNFYGQAIGATITDTGGTNLYFDTSLNTPGPNNNAFFEISLRELSY